jgi:hypothetical protein
VFPLRAVGFSSNLRDRVDHKRQGQADSLEIVQFTPSAVVYL